MNVTANSSDIDRQSISYPIMFFCLPKPLKIREGGASNFGTLDKIYPESMSGWYKLLL